MRRLLIVALAVVVVASLCYGAVKVNIDLVGRVADQSTWNITGQEFTIYLASSDSAFELLIPPSMDTIRLLYIRSTTLDANNNLYPFKFTWGDTTKALTLDTFLGTNLTHKSGVGIPAACSIWIANDNDNYVAIELSVFAAGQD